MFKKNRLKLERNYLRAEEIMEIVNSVVSKETEVEREVVKVALVAQYLMDDEFFKDEDGCGGIYNRIMEIGLYKEITNVENYIELELVIERELGISSLIEKTFSAFKGLDTSGIMEKLNGKL